MKLYKRLDTIHDPSIYDIHPNDSEWIEVNINKLVSRLNLEQFGHEGSAYIPPKVANSLFLSLSG